MATYDDIIELVLFLANKEKPINSIKTCWVAENKVLNGIPVEPSWNRKGIDRVEPCPQWLYKHFTKAFLQLGMI